MAMLMSEQCLIKYVLLFLQLSLQLTVLSTPQEMKGTVLIHAHLLHVSYT